MKRIVAYNATFDKKAGNEIHVTLRQSPKILNDKMIAGFSADGVIQLKSMLKRVYNNLEK